MGMGPSLIFLGIVFFLIFLFSLSVWLGFAVLLLGLGFLIVAGNS